MIILTISVWFLAHFLDYTGKTQVTLPKGLSLSSSANNAEPTTRVDIQQGHAYEESLFKDLDLKHVCNHSKKSPSKKDVHDSVAALKKFATVSNCIQKEGFDFEHTNLSWGCSHLYTHGTAHVSICGPENFAMGCSRVADYVLYLEYMCFKDGNDALYLGGQVQYGNLGDVVIISEVPQRIITRLAWR